MLWRVQSYALPLMQPFPYAINQFKLKNCLPQENEDGEDLLPEVNQLDELLREVTTYSDRETTMEGSYSFHEQSSHDSEIEANVVREFLRREGSRMEYMPEPPVRGGVGRGCVLCVAGVHVEVFSNLIPILIHVPIPRCCDLPTKLLSVYILS